MSQRSHHPRLSDCARSAFGHPTQQSVSPSQPDGQSTVSYATGRQRTFLDRQESVVVKQGSSGVDYDFAGSWAGLVVSTGSQRMGSDVQAFSVNVLDALVSLVQGNPEEEKKLADTTHVLAALVTLLMHDDSALHDRASLLLSQLALSHPDIAVRITKVTANCPLIVYCCLFVCVYLGHIPP